MIRASGALRVTRLMLPAMASASLSGVSALNSSIPASVPCENALRSTPRESGIGRRDADAVDREARELVAHAAEDHLVRFAARTDDRHTREAADRFGGIGIRQFLDLLFRDHVDDGGGGDLLIDGSDLTAGLRGDDDLITFQDIRDEGGIEGHDLFAAEGDGYLPLLVADVGDPDPVGAGGDTRDIEPSFTVR